MDQKVKTILKILLGMCLMIFVFVQIGLANKLGWMSYKSIEEFERTSGLEYVEIYDVYDYISYNKLTPVKEHDFIIERSHNDIRYRIVDNQSNCRYYVLLGGVGGMYPYYDQQVVEYVSYGEVFIGNKEDCINVQYRYCPSGINNDLMIEFDILDQGISREQLDPIIVNYIEENIKANPQFFTNK